MLLASCGMHVTGTASAPRFKIDPAAVTSVIKAGLTGSRDTGTKTPRTGKSTRKKDALNNFLLGALGSKSGH
ncbi:hypothetical protein EAH88_11210 [Rhodanobacter glycinis]|uniref:Uncharacterized protein n=2 Tax=Rhodanobacter glycinis TaxID=582702 RepID=A0A502C684_9GAMM|nr:hypothetical protein EAH88_11210 [Rhodanobacter glycinis]